MTEYEAKKAQWLEYILEGVKLLACDNNHISCKIILEGMEIAVEDLQRIELCEIAKETSGTG